jgi:hypothetical protein
LLSNFYEWTSWAYWGTQPVTLVDEIVWIVAGLLTAVIIVTVSFQWLATWTLGPAMVVGLFAAIVVSFVPLKHSQQFVECESSEQVTQVNDELIEMTITRCRTRDTLDSEWTKWQLHSGKFK